MGYGFRYLSGYRFFYMISGTKPGMVSLIFETYVLRVILISSAARVKLTLIKERTFAYNTNKRSCQRWLHHVWEVPGANYRNHLWRPEREHHPTKNTDPQHSGSADPGNVPGDGETPSIQWKQYPVLETRERKGNARFLIWNGNCRESWSTIRRFWIHGPTLSPQFAPKG